MGDGAEGRAPERRRLRAGRAGGAPARTADGRVPRAIRRPPDFWEEAGKRGGILVVNLEKTSQIPAIAEPWFLYFDAGVEFHPCMTPQDLAAAGLEALGKKYAG